MIGPYQVLPLRARVDLGAMAMNGYSAFSKAPALLEPPHYVVSCHKQDTLWGRGSNLSPDVYCTGTLSDQYCWRVIYWTWRECIDTLSFVKSYIYRYKKWWTLPYGIEHSGEEIYGCHSHNAKLFKQIKHSGIR